MLPLSLVLMVKCLVSRWPVRFPPPILRAPDHTRVTCIHAQQEQNPQHNAQQAAGKPIGRRLQKYIPAHLGMLTRAYKPHNSIAKGTR